MKLAAFLLLLAAASAQAQDGRPLGLGVATPTALSAERPLYFYGAADGRPNAAPFDSLTFRQGAHHVEIATAPPWLDPETVKLDYDAVTFRVVSLTRNWAEVVVHGRDVRWPPRTLWLDRGAVDFQSWPDYLLAVHSVETPRAAALHAAPDAASARLGVTSAGRPMRVLRVRHGWAQVVDADAGEGAPRGWIRWHGPAGGGERLLVTINTLS